MGSRKEKRTIATVSRLEPTPWSRAALDSQVVTRENAPALRLFARSGVGDPLLFCPRQICFRSSTKSASKLGLAQTNELAVPQSRRGFNRACWRLRYRHCTPPLIITEIGIGRAWHGAADARPDDRKPPLPRALAWRAALISRVSEPFLCSALRVLVHWAWGVVAAAVARLESERRYERRAVSAAVELVSAAVRAQGLAQRPVARKIERTEQHSIVLPARQSSCGGATTIIEMTAELRRAPGQTANVNIEEGLGRHQRR